MSMENKKQEKSIVSIQMASYDERQDIKEKVNKTLNDNYIGTTVYRYKFDGTDYKVTKIYITKVEHCSQSTSEFIYHDDKLLRVSGNNLALFTIKKMENLFINSNY